MIWRQLIWDAVGGEDETQREHRAGVFIGLFWSCIWLFWLIEPLVAAIHERDHVRGAVGVISIVLFGAVYAWHFVKRGTIFSDDPAERARTPRWFSAPNLARYAVLVVLAAVATVAVGQDGAVALTFTAISALWTFPLRAGIGVCIVFGISYALSWSHVPGWRSDSGTLVGLGFATLAVAAGSLAGRRQQQLAVSRRENARLAVEEERNRMARDVHDILGHSLTVVTVKAELASRLVQVDPVRAKAEIDDIERLSRAALADVRKAVEGFREISLSAEIARAREALQAANIEVEVPSALDEVPAGLQETFAWTVRESTTNVLRHSHATRCVISVQPDGISVADNGRGQSPGGDREPAGAGAGCKGNGLRGLGERARAAGLVLVTRQLEPGFEVSVRTPSSARRLRADPAR